jgi:hypothetical protein
MRRRELLYSLLGAAAVPSFVQAQSARSADDLPAFELTSPDAVAKSAPRFFGGPQFASFARLGDVLMPAAENEPGALDARAPEFLDFLLSESPAELQVLYRNGVHELDARSTRALKRPFVKLTAAEAAPILAPLSEPLTYQGPTEPFAQFLQAAKVAFWQATRNSREWAEAQSGLRRGAAGVNTYWLPIE